MKAFNIHTYVFFYQIILWASFTLSLHHKYIIIPSHGSKKSLFCRPLRQVAYRPIDIDIDNDLLRLNTGIYNFKYTNESCSVFIDLYSVIHIADREYYTTIQEMMQFYDIILYELITDDENVIYDNCNTNNDPYKRRLIRKVFSPQVNDLAMSLGLISQLELNLYKNNWYIADLNSKQINRLEHSNRFEIQFNYWKSIFFGRAATERLMKSFSMSDIGFISMLRLMIWAGPCPELGNGVICIFIQDVIVNDVQL